MAFWVVRCRLRVTDFLRCPGMKKDLLMISNLILSQVCAPPLRTCKSLEQSQGSAITFWSEQLQLLFFITFQPSPLGSYQLQNLANLQLRIPSLHIFAVLSSLLCYTILRSLWRGYRRFDSTPTAFCCLWPWRAALMCHLRTHCLPHLFEALLQADLPKIGLRHPHCDRKARKSVRMRIPSQA